MCTGALASKRQKLLLSSVSVSNTLLLDDDLTSFFCSSEENHSQLRRHRTPKIHRNLQLPQAIAYARMILLCKFGVYMSMWKECIFIYLYLDRVTNRYIFTKTAPDILNTFWGECCCY